MRIVEALLCWTCGADYRRPRLDDLTVDALAPDGQPIEWARCGCGSILDAPTDGPIGFYGRRAPMVGGRSLRDATLRRAIRRTLETSAAAHAQNRAVVASPSDSRQVRRAKARARARGRV